MRYRLPTVLILALAVAIAPAGAQPARGAVMVRIPSGSYLPLHGADDRQAVNAFALDRDPVTRGEYDAFLRRHPQWRGAATRAMVAADARQPATGMTWHAARAYCAERGARLPSLAEWEYAAAASETHRDAARDPTFVQRLVTGYATRPRPLPPVDRAWRNAYGVRGLHDLAWEWVADAGHAPDHDGHEAHGAWCASAALGAADPGNYAAFLRFAVRSRLTPESTMETLGFRCAT
ncbi:MAG TPA: formylglycine-generating enzyme family protein [Gemmatimonadaceae bacterium]|nr:formylglycine-generating enzyme family protein [Gemmatimonadaceae bacterium]